VTDPREALRNRIGVSSVWASCGQDIHAVTPMVRIWPFGGVETHYEWLVETSDGEKKINRWSAEDVELMIDHMLWHSPRWEVKENA
jgi:hypothetical protein